MIGVVTDGREVRDGGRHPDERSTTPTAGNLLPPLTDPTDWGAIRFGDRVLTYRELTYRELTGLAIHHAGLLESNPRVAVWRVSCCPAGDLIQPRRLGRRLGMDRRRRARPCAAAVPRPRADPRRARGRSASAAPSTTWSASRPRR